MERVTDLNYWMDSKLKDNLNTVAYNMDNDFDFVGGISGSGMVRVGKSMVAQQVGYYIAYKKGTPFTLANVVFSGDELIKVAHNLPKNSVIIYDEARGDLNNKRMMETYTKTLLDFFAECGMYNHFILLVLPDFFELPKGIAINRSEFLINVFRTSSETSDKTGDKVMKFERGYFEFYNRIGKKKLYIYGKKNFDEYDSKLRSFWGEFRPFWVLDKEEYESKKLDYLKRDREGKSKKEDNRFAIALSAMADRFGYSETSRMLKNQGYSLSDVSIRKIILSYRPKS